MTNDEATEWHREVISDATEAVLRSLRDAKVLTAFTLPVEQALVPLVTGCRGIWISSHQIFLTKVSCCHRSTDSLAFHWLRRNPHTPQSSKKRK